MMFNDHKLRTATLGRNLNGQDDVSIASFSVWGKLVLGIIFFAMSTLLFYQYRSIHSENESVNSVLSDNFTPSTDFLRSTLDQCNSLFHTQQRIDILRKQIWHNWNVSHYPYFLKLMEIPQTSWKLQKLKFLKLISESMSNYNEDLQFVMGFSGSSVTAGHDNYFYEAYPNIVYENLRPIFQLLNVTLIVRNHAIGNNPCYAYDACIATHLGDDLDIVTWEQSMNCGRNVKPLDTFTRQSQFMGKRPTVVYFLSGSPIWTEESCRAENITSNIQDHRIPLSDEELQLLSSSPATITGNNPLMENFEFLKETIEEMASSLPTRFISAAPMAQSVFPIQSYHCYGPYNASFTVKTPGGGAAWHPGKQGHRLRGDNFAYMLLSILSEAIQDYQTLGCESSKSDKNRRRLSQTRERRLLSDRQGSPVEGTIELLMKYLALEVSAESLRDLTFNNSSITSFSHVFKGFLEKYLMEYYLKQHIRTVPKSYQLPETNYPSHCYTDFEPRILNPLASIIYTPSAGADVTTAATAWKREISFFDKNAIAKAEKRQLGYLDRKYVYMSAGLGSSIKFKLSVQHNSSIWLCELQKGFGKYPATMADLDQGANITLSLHGKTEPEFQGEIRISLLSDQCYRSMSTIPKGDHILTITQNSEKQVNIAYIVTW